jgi:hypothetical protein
MSAEADLRERQAINESLAQLRRGCPPSRVAQSLEDAHAAIEDLRHLDTETGTCVS